MESIEFIAALFISVCWIRGFEYTFNDGEIFGKTGNWMRDKFPEWVSKPLFNCRYCMSSVHGTLIFCLLLWGYPWYMWVVFCFCTCGFVTITSE
jgi:hypothetical protein